jgi:small-conductance mechanosensitive channel
MATLTLPQLNRQIMTAGYTLAELNSIIESVKFARTVLAKEVKSTLTVGSRVEFTDTRNRITYQGTVMKVAIKNVTVRTDTGPMYRVPASMLTAV